jgi:phage shock protein PspC (stress-responsive transcriptional regulator)
MNKTVNINLGGLIFHIDENAYLKLQNYLNAVRRSFAGASGEDEIIADIESRIAELFSQKIKHDKQVVSIKEIDEVIEVMGQPEDYMVDDDIFDEQTKENRHNANTIKKLYRDVDQKYISGVSAGLGHYLGLNPIWVRLIFILTLQFGSLLVYIILWILIPEANTTSEKIAMTGDPINISNIEKKIKEGFDNASDTVKNVDYNKYSNKAQSGISSFFDTLGNIITSLFNVFGKLIGILLIMIGTLTIISLFIGMFTMSSFDVFNIGFIEQLDLYDYAPVWPIWVCSILAFFVVGIPFFFIAYLGLKILVSNLKSIGRIAKFSLLGIWLLAIIFGIVFGLKMAIKQKVNDYVIVKQDLYLEQEDTLRIKMNTKELYSSSLRRTANEKFVYDENDVQYIYSQDVRLIIKSTKDTTASITIKKEANGHSQSAARARAKDIEYKYTLENNRLSLNNYFLASPDQKFNGQEIEITLNIPIGTIIYADDNTYYYHRSSDRYEDILENGDEEHFLKIINNATECLDCFDAKFKNGNGNLNINENGINITIDEDGEKGKVIIDENGINIDINENSGENFKLKIDENGIIINKDKN